jgi:hypothetical protein
MTIMYPVDLLPGNCFTVSRGPEANTENSTRLLVTRIRAQIVWALAT